MPYKDVAKKRECQRRLLRERREMFFADRSCEWCAATEDLQLHHRDRSAKTDHKIWSWSETRFQAEVAKCVVVCGPCHRRSHADTRRIEAELRNPHGTVNRYKLGCRCDPCRAGNRDWLRLWREEREVAHA